MIKTDFFKNTSSILNNTDIALNQKHITSLTHWYLWQLLLEFKSYDKNEYEWTTSKFYNLYYNYRTNRK